MSTDQLLRILYVGRKLKLAHALDALMEQRNLELLQRDGPPQPTVTFTAVVNQQLAFATVGEAPPAVVMVELERKSASRVRFCEMLRNRLPLVTIFAVTSESPESSPHFDGLISVPLVAQQVFGLLETVQNRCNEYLLQRGSLVLNIASRTVTTPNGKHVMTRKQCALLQLLMENHDSVVLRGDIMQSIWDTSYLDDTRTLDVHIRWLRQRIEPDPSNPTYLRTVRGKGYRLNVTDTVT